MMHEYIPYSIEAEIEISVYRHTLLVGGCTVKQCLVLPSNRVVALCSQLHSR